MFQIISSVSYLLSSIMNCVSHLVKESIPNYLHNLPVPDSVLGWFSLSLSDWAKLVPFGVAVGGLSYLSLQARTINLHHIDHVPVNLYFRVSLILPSLGRLSRRNSPCFPGLNPTELTRPSRWSVLRSWTLWTSSTWETRGSSAGKLILRFIVFQH